MATYLWVGLLTFLPEYHRMTQVVIEPISGVNAWEVFLNSNYRTNIQPYVDAEYELARQAKAHGRHNVEFSHLENAHVLGQESTFLHTKTHCLMLLWALRQSQLKEILGQLIRIVGAATKTAVGLVPQGNTGGANVSPFLAMEFKPEHAKMIAAARSYK